MVSEQSRNDEGGIDLLVILSLKGRASMEEGEGEQRRHAADDPRVSVG